jgi:hypothetical protein
MLHLAHVLLYWLIEAIRPLWVPLCFVCAWTIVVLLGWNIWTAIRDGVAHAKHLHEIPCAHCQFFTNNHRLKCPVHPKKALSDEAINCSDYAPIAYSASLYGRDSHSRGGGDQE